MLEAIDGVETTGVSNPDITGLAYDSRRVRPGDLFFGLSGLHADGQLFVRDALAQGAVAAVVSRDLSLEGPIIRVAEPRKAMALAAANFYGHPSRQLTVIGVTGTNGKTTTTYLVDEILRASGMTTGLVGTTGYRVGDEVLPAPFTTPEAPELQALLRTMVARGLGGLAIELSSHALVQRRCYGMECDVAIFTNLSHDHLDFHQTLERYLDAKLMLFDGRNGIAATKSTTAVVNLDDPHAGSVIDAARRGALAIVTFGERRGADVAIGSNVPQERGLTFTLHHGGRAYPVALPLLGRYNAWNAAAAFAAARALGIAAETAVAGLDHAPAVPGRLERIDEGQPFDVLVDYAHTPAALASALGAVREHSRGRILLVFGCGGDRDRAKRPIMGRVASERSDLAWVTNDNPRNERPEDIASEIVSGAAPGRLRIVLDRRSAIDEALGSAAGGDTVVLAGKGHETTQTLGTSVLPFDDREVARTLLRARSGARG